MALSADAIAQRVIDQLDQNGMRSKTGGKDSGTAVLVRLIVGEIVRALKQEAQVNTTVQTTGSPTNHTGVGKGFIS